MKEFKSIKSLKIKYFYGKYKQKLKLGKSIKKSHLTCKISRNRLCKTQNYRNDTPN